ncbi:MAG: hypothetical protein PHG99_05845 [Erysipelotrichaceae bacterium]|nr:hypothetical protein [Erysipelotrichaceae bacterium]MDD4643000.1 hypothetical protein [Erysipelotrichaceae bacterium]
MVKVYNRTALTKKQRFNNALIYGIPTALGLGLAYGIIVSIIRVEFSIIFVGIGYLIGKVIAEKGRGVQTKFSILAAILALFSFLIADLIAIYGLRILLFPQLIPSALFSILINWLNIASFSGILGIIFRGVGIYYAYMNAKVV